MASVVGPGDLDPAALVKDGADGFRALLVEWGVPSVTATKLQRMLELHAARTLFEKSLPDLPSGFVSAIEKAREVNDALVIGA